MATTFANLRNPLLYVDLILGLDEMAGLLAPSPLSGASSLQSSMAFRGGYPLWGGTRPATDLRLLFAVKKDTT